MSNVPHERWIAKDMGEGIVVGSVLNDLGLDKRGELPMLRVAFVYGNHVRVEPMPWFGTFPREQREVRGTVVYVGPEDMRWRRYELHLGAYNAGVDTDTLADA